MSDSTPTDDHATIWLEPRPGSPDGRQWCQDDVWTGNPDYSEGGSPTKYVRADRFEQAQRTLAFFASVIKSGEPWTATCEAEYRKVMNNPPTQPTGLAPTELVAIEGDDVVIRVSLDALVFASEHGCLTTFSETKNDFRTVKVTDPTAWRDAFVRALRREQENGDTPVHRMLDEALEHAVEQGEDGISIEGILP